MKTLNKVTKIEFANNTELSNSELTDFAYKNAIKLDKGIDINNLILKLKFQTGNIPDGFQVCCFEQMSDFEKKILGKAKYGGNLCFYYHNPLMPNDKNRQTSFEIDLAEEFEIDEYIIDKIAIIPKEKNITFECLVVEK